jgi:hypothetical protein
LSLSPQFRPLTSSPPMPHLAMDSVAPHIRSCFGGLLDRLARHIKKSCRAFSNSGHVSQLGPTLKESGTHWVMHCTMQARWPGL